VRETGSHRTAFSAVRRVHDDVGAGRARGVRCAICRTVVDDQDLRHERQDAANHVGDRPGLIVSGHQRGGFHLHPRILIMSAGSNKTDATASAETLTADTRPIDRSGGYEELISVP
jgi:hypothetical protein